MSEFERGWIAGRDAAADEIESTRQGAASLPKYLIIDRVRALVPPQQPRYRKCVADNCTSTATHGLGVPRLCWAHAGDLPEQGPERIDVPATALGGERK